ncbi:TPA: hypothetical protein ACGIK9_003274 [Acinetobacter baumannii]
MNIIKFLRSFNTIDTYLILSLLLLAGTIYLFFR